MALVRKLEAQSRRVTRVHDEVRCTYTPYRAKDQNQYLQINTYGKPDRHYTDTVSQTIQFDKNAAQ